MSLVSLSFHLTPQDLPQPLIDVLRYDWAFPATRPAQADLPILIGTLPARPETEPHPTRLPERDVPVWRRPNELWINGELYLDATPGQAHLIAAHPEVSRDLWVLALTELHRAAGWLPMHAALLGQDGQVVAISGQSGAGKSTACLRLQRQGLTVHAEDRVWYHPTGEVVGMDRTMRAYSDSLQRFAPDLLAAHAGGPRDPRGKHILPLPSQGPATLRGLILLGATSSAPHDRVRHAWELTGVPLTTVARTQSAHAVQALLTRVPWHTATREQLDTQIRASLRAQGTSAAP